MEEILTVPTMQALPTFPALSAIPTGAVPTIPTLPSTAVPSNLGLVYYDYVVGIGGVFHGLT